MTNLNLQLKKSFCLLLFWKNSLNGRNGRDVDLVFYKNNPIDYKKLNFPETLERSDDIIYFTK